TVSPEPASIQATPVPARSILGMAAPPGTQPGPVSQIPDLAAMEAQILELPIVERLELAAREARRMTPAHCAQQCCETRKDETTPPRAAGGAAESRKFISTHRSLTPPFGMSRRRGRRGGFGSARVIFGPRPILCCNYPEKCDKGHALSVRDV